MANLYNISMSEHYTNTIQWKENGGKMGERGKEKSKSRKKHNLEFKISKFLNFRTLRRAKKLQSDFK